MIQIVTGNKAVVLILKPVPPQAERVFLADAAKILSCYKKFNK